MHRNCQSSSMEGSGLPNTSVMPRNGECMNHCERRQGVAGMTCRNGPKGAQRPAYTCLHTAPRLASHVAAYWPERHCTLQERTPNREHVTPQKLTVQNKPWLLHETPCMDADKCWAIVATLETTQKARGRHRTLSLSCLSPCRLLFNS